MKWIIFEMSCLAKTVCRSDFSAKKVIGKIGAYLLLRTIFSNMNRLIAKIIGGVDPLIFMRNVARNEVTNAVIGIKELSSYSIYLRSYLTC